MEVKNKQKFQSTRSLAKVNLGKTYLDYLEASDYNLRTKIYAKGLFKSHYHEYNSKYKKYDN